MQIIWIIIRIDSWKYTEYSFMECVSCNKIVTWSNMNTHKETAKRNQKIEFDVSDYQTVAAKN